MQTQEEWLDYLLSFLINEGCFVPCHGCIDNAIHSAAGLQLRQECARIMAVQGMEEPVERAKITRAYNLPCRYVLHTVGPFISGKVEVKDRDYEIYKELLGGH